MSTMEMVGVASEEEDSARPEATFSFTVERFASLKDSALSHACIVRNLPWKIMIMPRANANSPGGRSVGFFLQCSGESESSSWSCQASAELRVISQVEGKETFGRKISHLFYSKENDWGFSHYMSWNEIMDPEKGFIKDDKITFEVRVTADAPHGVSWDSKKHTGYVGLRNQGATCYMNSLLQVLYFTNSLRRSVYKMPTEVDESAKSVALALQRVFHDLQFMDKAVGTKKLTKSFGWETLDSFMQHDVQEFLRVLLDKLEMKMKGTSVEGTIPKLFEGKTISYIRCKNIPYTSSRTESFYDVQLSIKDKLNLHESFADYIQTQTLDGENKYDAGDHGLQDAEKGILFESFPPVLHLHLMRFQYDAITDSSVKYNGKFEFPSELDLSDFLKKTPDGKRHESEEAMEVDGEDSSKIDLTTYILHAVLVHSGDNHGGHYVVFINPKGDGKWCKFDDDVVSRCTEKEAIQNNFGGMDDDVACRQSSNAYMLVYIRKSALSEILCDVTEATIPVALIERFEFEKRWELARRKEKSESHLYMTLRILQEDSFVGHQGNDLFDPDKAVYTEVRVKKADTLREVLDLLSELMKRPADQIRLWPMNTRTNQTVRPSIIDTDTDMDKGIFELLDGACISTLFLEMTSPDVPAAPLPTFDKDSDVLLFFKFYDPVKEKLHYLGLMYASIMTKVETLAPELARRANLPIDTPLIMYEEIKPNMMERIEDLDRSLEQLEELMDGDIIVIQKEVPEGSSYRLPYCRDYFRDLFHKVEVAFVDKNTPQDSGFVLTLSQRMNYNQIAQAAAEKLDIPPDRLQFFRPQNYRELPGHALRCTFEGTLKDLIVYSRPKQPKKLFFQKLDIPIHELENKKQFKCTWLSLDHKEEKELVLYPKKTGTVVDIFEEAQGQVQLSRPNAKLRLLDIGSHKILGVNNEAARVDQLVTSSAGGTKSYRLEEVPPSQENLGQDEFLVPVVHFQKEIYSTFGHPFYIKVKDGEKFTSVREKIQKWLEVPDKEFEKYRIAIINMSRVKYLEDLQHDSIRQRDFMSSSQTSSHPKPYIGLEHVNKNSKRARYNYMEKAIKIYN